VGTGEGERQTFEELLNGERAYGLLDHIGKECSLNNAAIIERLEKNN